MVRVWGRVARMGAVWGSGRVRRRRPFLLALAAKMSAKEGAMTHRIPASTRA